MIRLDYRVSRQHPLEAGDVLMVAMELNDKHKKGRTFIWRFFAVVTKDNKHRSQVVALVLDEREREPLTLSLAREETVVHLLAPEEWPDGVHAFRTKAILDGKVDAIF